MRPKRTPQIGDVFWNRDQPRRKTTNPKRLGRFDIIDIKAAPEGGRRIIIGDEKTDRGPARRHVREDLFVRAYKFIDGTEI